MKLKLALPAAALLGAAFPALAQSQDAPGAQALDPEAPIQQAARAFGQCIADGLEEVQPAISPEQAAAGVFDGCARERAQLEEAIDAMIVDLPAEQQEKAREQVRTQLAQAEVEIAEAIREQREEAQPAGVE